MLSRRKRGRGRERESERDSCNRWKWNARGAGGGGKRKNQDNAYTQQASQASNATASLPHCLSLISLSISLYLSLCQCTHAFCAPNSALRAAEQTALPDNMSRTKIDTNRIQSTLTSAHSNNNNNNNSDNNRGSSSHSDSLSPALCLFVYSWFFAGIFTCIASLFFHGKFVKKSAFINRISWYFVFCWK